MAEKRLPAGVCDCCGELFPPSVSLYTRRGPRLYCSVACRNTANSRAGAGVRGMKARQRVAAGVWQNPHLLHPPTGEEQSARARKGRLREVAEGRWRNPALTPEAREKLSRPRKYGDDPVLHRAMEKLRQGVRVAGLSEEEHARFLAYQRELRQARLAEVRAYYRARYRRIMDGGDAAAQERLRALWRRQNQRRAAQKRQPAVGAVKDG